MQTFESIKLIDLYLSDQRQKKVSIGFIPTMGALHQGHLTLMEQAQKENDIIVCSIYVNPTQFNNTNDLEKYPRNIEHDKILLEKVGCDVLFHPSDTIMYPEEKKNSIKLDFGSLDKMLEGAFRPGHFSGVGLILSKLFHIVQADRVYFGQKDLQQCSVVQKLIDDLFFNVQLRVVPTVREESGLAMSSRNERLSQEGKATAANLYKALTKVRDVLLRQGNFEAAREEGFRFLATQQAIQLEYLEIIDRKNFEQATQNTPNEDLAVCVAAFVEEVRLIDNVVVFS